MVTGVPDCRPDHPFIVVGRDEIRRTEARFLVEEAGVALDYNGITYAVMMATPSDLEDFARGFALTEMLATRITDIGQPVVTKVEKGWLVRTMIASLPQERLAERVRTRVAESSCGLCGMENLNVLGKPLSRVASHPAIVPAAIFAALAALPAHQLMGHATKASHAAALVDWHGNILCLREDVGRHIALDKLVGAAAMSHKNMAAGFVLSTARCSYEIVEKAVCAGATSLVTLSLPTNLALERARQAGLSLWVLARDDSVLLANDGAA